MCIKTPKKKLSNAIGKNSGCLKTMVYEASHFMSGGHLQSETVETALLVSRIRFLLVDWKFLLIFNLVKDWKYKIIKFIELFN